MTALEWSRITDLLETLVAEPQLKRTLLEPEPRPIREEVERLLAAHEALESSATPPRVKRVIRGRYEFQSLLGVGGSGEAWLCHDRQTGDLVVVKLARNWEWFRADLKQRFQAEVEILRSLRHPNIIQILDFGETEEGAPFLVMPFIDGLTLRALLEVGPLNPEPAVSILQQLGDAISAAHKARVTHRDIKPENVMLQAQPNGSYRTFLIDFGIALFADLEQQAGTTTRFFGTTQYMAPEQLLGKPAPASDTYALALVTYEMLSGESLLKAQTPVGLYDEARHLKPSHMHASLAGGVRSVLLEALNPNPQRRPTDASAFAARLADQIREPGLRMPSRRTVLRIGLGTAALVVPGAAWLNYEYGAPSDNERRLTLKAGTRFEQAGWQKVGQIDQQTTGAVVGTSLMTKSKGSYFHSFSPRLQRAAVTRPWRAIFFFRPLHGQSGFAVSLRQAGSLFMLAVTVPPEGGDPIVRLIETFELVVKEKQAPLRLNGERLLKFELNYDPAKRQAALLVDGQLFMDGYTGATELIEQEGLGVAVGAVRDEPGEGLYGDISFLLG